MTPIRRIACAMLIAAAATATHAKKEEVDATPVPGHGAVLLTVTIDSNVHFGGIVPGGYPSLVVERVGEAKPTPLHVAATIGGAETSRIYAASLAPGRYRIVSVCAGCHEEEDPGEIADFSVVEGRTHWLGNLMLRVDGTGKRKDPFVDHWAWHERPDPRFARRLFEARFPELAAATTLVSGGWEPLAGVDPAAAGDALRRRGAGLLEPMPFGADGFHFGGLHGVVKRWRPGGPLQLIDTGSPFALRSVVHLADGRMLAGGEAGTLLYSADDGRSWRDVADGVPYGVIPQVLSAGDDEVVFTLIKEKSVALYRGRLGGDGWTLVGDYPLEFATWTGIPGKYPELHVVGRTLALSLPSKSGLFLDLDTGESHRFDLPGGISAFAYTADGVMRCRCARTLATNPWESRDRGRTWGESSLNRWSALPVFRDDRHAFTYKGAWLDPKQSGVFASDDGAATWRGLAKPSDGFFMAQRWSADGSTMLLAGFDLVDKRQVPAAYASRDGGQTWTAMPTEGDWLHPPQAAAD